MGFVRQPAVAGRFYPGERSALERAVGDYLAGAEPAEAGTEAAAPKAVIAPHAGYVYSGPVAANVYARLAPARQVIRRVVLMGPAHRVPLSGLAVSGADAFLTPLGPVPVDRAAVEAVLALPQVRLMDEAHEGEHSLEVHLPFLQRVLDRFAILPMVAGRAAPDAVAEVLELIWGGDETLILISSDLSHYHDYATARRRDAATSRAIEALKPEAIGPRDACGSMVIGGLLRVAERRGMHARTIDLRNSGDTAGSRDRVVGYGAYLFG